MAGSYPDVPSNRIAYHVDGSVVWLTNTVAGGAFGGGGYYTGMVLPPVELSSTQKNDLNNEETTPALVVDGGPTAVDYGFGWIWPEKRDIFGFYGYGLTNGEYWLTDLEYSTQSRNMITKGATSADFIQIAQGYPSTDLAQPPGNNNWSVDQSYREYVNAFSSTGATGVRVATATPGTLSYAVDKMYVAALHWYGDIADGANPDRLLFINAGTGLVFDEVNDWGDLPRGSVHSLDIKIMNNSATLAATSNIITFEGVSGDSYTWYDIKDNAGASTAFSTSLTISGPLAAGATYPASTTLTLRITLDPDENLGPASAYLKLATGSWA